MNQVKGKISFGFREYAWFAATTLLLLVFGIALGLIDLITRLFGKRRK